MTKFAIVTTTIRIPFLLQEYAFNFKKYGWKNVFFVIAGDKKTPPAVENFCRSLEKKYEYAFFYLNLRKQKMLNKRLYKYIPFNSISRRNFAILFAYQRQADIIITIDDDNFISKEDYLKYHSLVGKKVKLSSVRSSTRWFNVCECLKEKNNKIFFHRGFPINQRSSSSRKVTILKKMVKVDANAGLWLDAPDTDAISWLNFGTLKVLSFDSKKFGSNFVLERGTWCPFNSQNTALSREVIPAYFLNPNFLRYDDIWASFVVRKIADHLNRYVSYGKPIVIQKRNIHNYIEDLKRELVGMERTPDLIEELRDIELEGESYLECTKSLIKNISNKFSDLRKGYKIWIKCLEEIDEDSHGEPV